MDYKEGWFETRQTGDTAESTLCGMQIHYNDQYIERFRAQDWSLIERFAQEGLLKQGVQWLGVKTKIEIPRTGTGFSVKQNALHIEHLPESWPMDTERAWRERYSKGDLTFQDIVDTYAKNVLRKTSLRAMTIRKHSAGRLCLMIIGPVAI